MPEQSKAGYWFEKCSYVEELEQIGNKKDEVQSIGKVECKFEAKGSTGAEALEALRMHVQGRHQQEDERRDAAVRKKKKDEDREEREAINREKLTHMEHEADIEVKKLVRIKEEEKNGEAKIGGMLNNLNANRAERVGDA